MRGLIFACFGSSALVGKLDATGSVNWSLGFGTVDCDDCSESAYSLARDGEGKLYVFGDSRKGEILRVGEQEFDLPLVPANYVNARRSFILEFVEP